MMNNLNKKTILFSSIILTVLILFSGCKHQLNNADNVEPGDFNYTIITVTGIKEARQASPAIDDEIIRKLTFTVTAKDSGNKDSKNKSDSDFFTRLTEGYTEKDFVYKIKLDPGEWNVTLTGKADGNEILTGSDTIVVKSNGSYSKDIKVNFITDGTITGNVNLSIEVRNVPEITKLTISGAQSGGTALNTSYPVEDKNGKRIISIAASSIRPGNYSIILSFCNNSDTQVFSIPEVVTVTRGMTTKYWFKSSRNPFLIDSDERGISSFVVTPALITEAVNTIFYVNSNDSTGKQTNNGNDYSTPLNNIQNAFNRINVNNNNDAAQGIKRNYIIFIDKKGTPSTISADNPLNLEIYPLGNEATSISGSFTIGQNIDLKLKNLTVTGAFTCDYTSTINAENITFSSSINAGHATTNGDTAIPNAAAITLNNCTVNGTTYCYSSSDGTEKCSITANNCTFKGTVTNDGTFTATSSELSNNLICNKSSSFILEAPAENKKNLSGSVTLNNSSTASFKNVNIGVKITSTNSISIKNESSAVFEDVEITKGIDAQSSITFVGNTKLVTGNVTTPTASTVSLKDGVVLKIKDVPSGDEKLAAIKVATPSPNLVVIEPVQGQTLSNTQIARFELHNNGYYLKYDSAGNGKGIIKLSSMKVIEPTFGGCTINLNGNGNIISSTTNNLYYVGQNDTAEELLITANSPEITTEYPNGVPLDITSVTQYLGNTVIASASGQKATQRTIAFDCSVLETYGLEVRFLYKEIEYGVMFTVKVIR